MIGKQVSHFRILEQIGQGGMGEVYLALDTKLERKVALKFLPESMESDPLARKRFWREAKAAASLDHPFIAHIHEIGEWEERSFLAMEYVEGETLNERLERGRLPLEDALKMSVEVAEALGLAHSQGIVHRDLKPSNIMILENRHVKVMDFGLAKFLKIKTGKAGGDAMTGLTGSGLRLGTLPYMSPEQLKGEELDTRSDIFAFGIVFYEMIVGVHPFKRVDSFETAGAILREQPPALTQSGPQASEVLNYILGKMLAKKPQQRYQSVTEIRTDLLSLLKTVRNLTASDPAASQSVQSSLVLYLTWILAFLAIAVLVIGVNYLDEDAGEKAILRLELGLEDGRRVAHYYRQGFAVSPDGSTLAIVSGSVENPYLFPNGVEIELRRLDEWQSRVIPGTTNGFQPFFSPDGQWLGFTAYSVEENSWYLKKVRVDGGEPRTLCECQARWGATWTRDGRMIFGTGSGGLMQVSEAGGEPQEITRLDEEAGEISHRLPFLLPDGHTVLVTVPMESNSLGNAAKISAVSLRTGDKVDLIDGWDGRYVPTGYLIFARDGNLHAASFDPVSLKVQGPEIPILEDVIQSLYTVNPILRTGGIQLAFADNGLMVYLAGSVFPEIKNTLVWVDRNGNEETVDVEPRNFFTVRVSDDSQKVLLTTLYPPQDVWLYDVSRGTVRRQTFEGDSLYAVWGPGTESFTFSSDLLGPRSVFVKEIDSGPRNPELLFDGNLTFLRPSAWSRDGQFLTYVEAQPGQNYDIGYLSREGEKKTLLATRFSEQYPEISPDGKWLLYTTDESGNQEVYIRPFPGPGRTHQISTGGGYEPAWSRDGNEICYRWRKEFFSVRVDFDPSRNQPSVGIPVKIFEGDYGSAFAVRSFELSGDGRFLMIRRPEELALRHAIDKFFPDRLQVVSNWFEEIESKLPAR